MRDKKRFGFRELSSNTYTYIHTYMHIFVRAILDDYGARSAIDRLSLEGYSIKVVGHSLGAGTSSLLAAELKNGFVGNVRSGLRQTVPQIQCYAYACPSCTSANIADAMCEDGLVMVMVNRDDPIPRISRASIMRLAEKVIAFASTADEWFEQDKAGFNNYVTAIGKKGEMVVRDKSVIVPPAAEAVDGTGRGDVLLATAVTPLDSSTITPDQTIEVTSIDTDQVSRKGAATIRFIVLFKQHKSFRP